MNVQIIYCRIRSGVRTLIFLLLFPVGIAFSQSAIRWYAIDPGFSQGSTSNSILLSAVGQGFVHEIVSDKSRIVSGFLAYRSQVGTTSVGMPSLHPAQPALDQNYPNPFPTSTTISYSLHVSQHVRLQVFDIYMRIVAVLVDQDQPPGLYEVRFLPIRLPGGNYFYRLDAGGDTMVRKMTVVR